MLFALSSAWMNAATVEMSLLGVELAGFFEGVRGPLAQDHDVGDLVLADALGQRARRRAGKPLISNKFGLPHESAAEPAPHPLLRASPIALFVMNGTSTMRKFGQAS